MDDDQQDRPPVGLGQDESLLKGPHPVQAIHVQFIGVGPQPFVAFQNTCARVLGCGFSSPSAAVQGSVRAIEKRAADRRESRT
jgi:hypothetical protein